MIDEGVDDPEVHFRYGQALMLDGQPGLAEWPLRKAMRTDEYFGQSNMLIAAHQLNSGNAESAAQTLDSLIEREPDNIEARLLRANAYAASPRHAEQAVEEADQVLDLAPDDARAYKPKILGLLQQNLPEEVREALDELGVAIESGDDADLMAGWYCATRAIFADESGEEEEARELWETCNAGHPALANVVYQSVEFHRKRQEFERALEIARAAYAEDSSTTNNYRSLVAAQLVSLQRYDEAESVLREGLESEQQRDQLQAWLGLTRFYELTGDLSAAADALEKGLIVARELDPSQPDLVFKLADLSISAGRDERALELAEEATVRAHQSLIAARVAHKRGDYARAMDLYAETTRLWPDNALAPYHSGRAAIAAGDFDRALADFMSSVRIDGDATDARIRAAELHLAEGRYVAAIELLNQGKQDPGLFQADLVLLEAIVHAHRDRVVAPFLKDISRRHPTQYGAAVAATAQAIADRDGEAAAWRFTTTFLGIDLPAINELPILRVASLLAPSTQARARLEARVEAILETLPGAPVARETRAILLERAGDLAGAAAIYRDLTDRWPGLASPAVRLARLRAAEAPDQSISLLRRAVDAPDFDPASFVAVVRLLPESDARVELLEAAIERAPLDGDIALLTATSLTHAEPAGAEAPRVRVLAERAIRFHSSDDERARALLAAAPAPRAAAATP